MSIAPKAASETLSKGTSLNSSVYVLPHQRIEQRIDKIIEKVG